MKTITRRSVSTSTQIKGQLAKAMEPVGSLAWRVVENLLLAKAKLAAGGGALAEEPKLTRLDELAVVNIAVRVEVAAINALAQLMVDDEFWKLLRQEHARRLSKDRSTRQSKVFEQVLREDLSAACKEVVRKLEQRGDLADDGEYYKVGGGRIKRSTLPSKLSRLRTHLRKRLQS